MTAVQPWCWIAAAISFLVTALGFPEPLCRQPSPLQSNDIVCDTEEGHFSSFHGPIPGSINVVTWNLDWNSRGGDGSNPQGKVHRKLHSCTHLIVVGLLPRLFLARRTSRASRNKTNSPRRRERWVGHPFSSGRFNFNGSGSRLFP